MSLLIDHSRLLLAEGDIQEALRVARWACEEADDMESRGSTRFNLQEIEQHILGYQSPDSSPGKVRDSFSQLEKMVGTMKRQVDSGKEIDLHQTMEVFLQNVAQIHGHSDIGVYFRVCEQHFTSDCLDILRYALSIGDPDLQRRLIPGFHRYLDQIREQNDTDSFRAELLSMALRIQAEQNVSAKELCDLMHRMGEAGLEWQGAFAFQELVKVLVSLSPGVIHEILPNMAASFQGFLRTLENMEVSGSPESIRQDLSDSYSTFESVGMGLLEIGSCIMPSLAGLLERVGRGSRQASSNDHNDRAFWFRLSRRLFATLHNLYGQTLRAMHHTGMTQRLSSKDAEEIEALRVALADHALAGLWDAFAQTRQTLALRQYAGRQTAQHRLFPDDLSDVDGYPCLQIFRAWHFVSPADGEGTIYYIHDNFDAREHMETPTVHFDLAKLVDQSVKRKLKMVDPDGLKQLAETLLVGELDERLPEYFGIRAGGLVQSIPWVLLPLADGRLLGECALPILFTQRNICLEPLLRPLSNPRILVVADAVYAEGDVNDGLEETQCLHPVTMEQTAFVDVLDVWRSETTPDLKQKRPAGKFAPLLGSRVEALAIRRLYPETTILLGRQANRQRVLDHLRRDKPTVLHIAVHGAARDGEADSGYLALSVLDAQGRAVVGAIGFHDIVGLDLRGICLVVLSACETLRGQNKEGEGLLSLAWAFLGAGVNGVVAGRWQVGDRYSLLFWERFYQCLNDGQAIIPALKKAQMQCMQDPGLNNPFLWGAYQLVV